jgi:hypothetical protein
MGNSVLEVLDSEVDEITKILSVLQDRARLKAHNYEAFEREIRSRFEDIGFAVDVNWHSYAVGGVVQAGSAMPEVTVTGRLSSFDPDRQVWEVTQNILELPGQDKGEVIRTDQGDAFKKFRAGGGMDHGRSHGHGHPHSHGHSH